ncbi:putative metabolite transport protein [Thelohanellus kitauei]|uniref:Putative metabolite transport protein n=1 Tax=Thelohanellus kitauei TaxID=669202 RepID=A0A0C2JM71_THEKT|nr:putative metabolite transport protein [Thelohanellus kitauei]
MRLYKAGKGMRLPLSISVSLMVIIDKVGYNVRALFFNSFLLIAPLLFGIGIASLGNDEYIKRCFIRLHFGNKSMNQSNVTGEMFPAKVWSIGFVFPMGGWIGSLIAAFTVDRYGRKFPSIGFCLCAIIGSGLKFASRYIHIALLFLGRFFEGISSAGLMVSAVLLLLETIPRSVERTFKSLIQISLNFGILLVCCSSLYSVVDVNWNFSQLLNGGFAFIMMIGLVFNRESPKYIENRYKSPDKTEKALRGKFFDQKELEELKQLSGINAVPIILIQIMAFAPRLLLNAGFKNPDVGATIVMLFATIGSIIFAPFVARLRRKFLWILGLCSMSISFILFIIFQELSVLLYVTGKFDRGVGMLMRIRVHVSMWSRTGSMVHCYRDVSIGGKWCCSRCRTVTELARKLLGLLTFSYLRRNDESPIVDYLRCD